MKKPPTLSEVHAMLEALEHQPKKDYGQNFLVDKNILNKITEFAGIRKGDAVVEIGPGLGSLTLALLNQGANVYAVEKDRALYTFLEQNILKHYPQQLHLHCNDALVEPLASLPELLTQDFKIVANLPYAVASIWLEKVLLQSKNLPQSMTIMVQKEAADRFLCTSGKSFGPISILLQSAFDCVGTHQVSKRCFYPAPKIDSTVLHFSKKATPFRFSAPNYQIIRQLFTQRRKQLQGLCRERFQETQKPLTAWLASLEEKGYPKTMRAEQVSVEDWQTLEIQGAHSA